MIGCESEPLSLKSEYTLFRLECVRLAVVKPKLKLLESRKSKRELIILLGKNVFAILPTDQWEKLDFHIVLVGARKYNENNYRRPYTTFLQRVLNRTTMPSSRSLLAASLSVFLNFLRLSLPHGFVRKTRQFILAVHGLLHMQCVMSRLVMAKQFACVSDLSPTRPHGLQTRSDSSEVELTSIAK
jgi:hypothetical protein